jgi:hypothetical protein
MYHSSSKETIGEFTLTGKCMLLSSDSKTLFSFALGLLKRFLRGCEFYYDFQAENNSLLKYK